MFTFKFKQGELNRTKSIKLHKYPHYINVDFKVHPLFLCYKNRKSQQLKGYLALMRYWARLILAGVPVMVIWRSDEPSMALAILICAPDICRISFILVPWRPIMQPISWKKQALVFEHAAGAFALNVTDGFDKENEIQ